MAPRLSVATAVKVFVPSAKLPASAVPEKLYGAVVKLRSNTAPLKSWTFVTVPSESLAEVWTVMVSVLPKAALSAGLVMVTLGGMFAALTVTFTTAEVVERPRLSVATAVSAWLPAARLAVTV